MSDTVEVKSTGNHAVKRMLSCISLDLMRKSSSSKQGILSSTFAVVKMEVVSVSLCRLISRSGSELKCWVEVINEVNEGFELLSPA